MLTKEQSARVKAVLHSKRLGRPVVLLALSYVNIYEQELDILIRRHLHGHTQEKVAEDLGLSTNTVYNKEHSALEKCYYAWSNIDFTLQLMNAARN